MNNKKWLFFSFSVPSRLQGFRVKIWRRLNALGAVQIKNSIYVLPANAQSQEQLTWMGKETDEQGGESLIIANGNLLNIADLQVAAAFTKARRRLRCAERRNSSCGGRARFARAACRVAQV